MSEYMFAVGDGHLSKRAGQIAKDHDARLVNHTDPQCSCGRGCEPYTCRNSRRHWFSAQNLGEPFDSQRARDVEAALEAAGIKRD